ncbi:MAG: Putative Glycoside hydrolase, family 5 [Nitrospira sp.]|nr:hypothetical protein [Nitrospira sp.]ULA61377.1 MAG: Putative Glycoside hydrolase, family 5 [Nitrospira sp.]
MIQRQRASALHLTMGLTHALMLFCATLSQAGTIMVDLGVEQGPMNHRANGYLVSIEPDEPSMEFILPLKPTSFRGNAGYVFKNYDRLKQAGVTEFQLTLGLVFKDLPLQIFDINQIGQEGTYEPWLAHVDRIIDQVADRQLAVLWDIYNEPDLATLPINENERLKEGWRLAYRRIKHRIPGAQVVGPSISRYRLLKPFLEWSQEHNVFPDVVAYHEYDDPSNVPALVEDLRSYLKERGLARPISVNEILGQETWTLAGYTVGVIAAYERANIMSAMRSCWPDPQDMSRDRVENTCDNPTLDGLLYVDRQSKRPGWHIYKAYAEMEGVRLYTMTDSPKLHALASLDKASGTLQLLLGKYEDYSTADTTVVLKNASRAFSVGQGKRLHLCAEQIPDTGSGPLASTVVTLDRTLPLEDKDISFTLPQFYHSDAYRVRISPGFGCNSRD